MKSSLIFSAVAAVLVSAAPAEANRYCRGGHDKAIHCHRVLAPRINLKARHPIKILRCRAHRGHLGGC